ncbi:MAG: Ig-like domain repeat protein [Candidatus Brockarchaeota archaeon]|nr:Ig-like domain repeat protein [Candidatus Brockarchaeota archaeon]
MEKEKLMFLLEKKNVVGFSTELKPKIVKGKETEVKAIRVYVKKKELKLALKEEDIIPEEIDGIKTDVVEVGEIVAFFDPTQKVRPVTAGVSVGNIAITAGTLGWFYVDKNGNKYFGSNAHVFTPDPMQPPNNVSPKDIVQPGSYDGGTKNDKIGSYVNHVQLYPTSSGKTNNLDFAVASMDVDCDYKIWQQYTPTKIVGHLFAGSNTVTVIFKEHYVTDLGYSPINATVQDVNVGDYVQKWGRTSGYTIGKVLDTSAVVRVGGYSQGDATFVDQILTEAISSPGDSGSSVWLYEESKPYPTRLSMNAPTEVNTNQSFYVQGKLEYFYATWNPLVGATVDIYLDGNKYVSLTTDNNGAYWTSMSISSPGIHKIEASYAGTADYQPASTSQNINVIGQAPPPITAKFSEWTKKEIRIFGIKVGEIINRPIPLPYVGQPATGKLNLEEIKKAFKIENVYSLDLSKLGIPKTRSGETSYTAMIVVSYSDTSGWAILFLSGIGEQVITEGTIAIRAVNTDYWMVFSRNFVLYMLYAIS